MQNDTTQLKNRLTDLAARAEAQCIYTHSPFLSPEEQAVFLSLAQSFPVTARLDGGSESGIRKIAVFGSEADLGYAFESPIRVIRISPRAEKFAAELSHRDYLGALMGLGIDLVLASAVGGGREAIKRLMKEGRIFLNGQAVNSPGHHMKGGDVFVVRGQGKFIYDGITGTTKKGRCNIAVRKYV